MTARAADTANYIMLGGFLGAGKTTAVAQLARHLTARGKRVGLISNDQSTGLVDTILLRSQGFHVEEIAGGCFCCRFNSLVEAAEKLTSATKPDVFIAEPVGSCTDLVATVSYPLRRIYGDRFTIAPLSVLVDPHRAARIFGLADGRAFSPKVVYIYRKQIEEADTIVVNKCDILDESLRDRLVDRLREGFPRAEVLCCSAREGTGLDEWFDRILVTAPAGDQTMDLDYQRYGEGEALLGWLNCTVDLAADDPFDANALLADVATRIRGHLDDEAGEIAHLKMTLDSQEPGAGLAAISVVGGDPRPDLRESLAQRIRSGKLIINLRAEASPAKLRSATEEALYDCTKSRMSLTASMEHMECFRPSKPEPTHRIRNG